jgi:hypothetical protein
VIIRGKELRLVLWGDRALKFDAEAVRAMGEKEPVIAIFVGTLSKTSHGEQFIVSLEFICFYYLMLSAAHVFLSLLTITLSVVLFLSLYIYTHNRLLCAFTVIGWSFADPKVCSRCQKLKRWFCLSLVH